MAITYTISISDLIQALGVLLGVPATIWGIFKLFQRDKEKESHINSLENIAKSQDMAIEKMTEQIDELSKQTSQFVYQSFLLKEGNDLLKEQIRIQTDALLNDKNHKDAYLKLEMEKRKSEIRPFFRHGGGFSGSNGFSLPFINFGNIAYKVRIEIIDAQNMHVTSPRVEIQVIENTMHFDFNASYNIQKGINLSWIYEFNILFEDVDRNRYKQHVTGQSINNVKVGFPEELN